MKKRGIPVLIPVLILISMVFIGILIFTYIETKKANPQMIRVSNASRPEEGVKSGEPFDFRYVTPQSEPRPFGSAEKRQVTGRSLTVAALIGAPIGDRRYSSHLSTDAALIGAPIGDRQYSSHLSTDAVVIGAAPVGNGRQGSTAAPQS